MSVKPISGSNGAGLLLDTGCLPSAPMSSGPWQIFGMVNGKLAPIGKPLYAEGEMGDFVPGKVTHMGNLTQILADELRIRLFTGYFFVSAPVRLNWMEGKLALAQHCFYQTGHGIAEGGCEMPIEGVERHPGEQELTFVRMFSESNEQIGTPAHVVVKKDSRVEILAGKVLVTWEEGKDGIGLGRPHRRQRRLDSQRRRLASHRPLSSGLGAASASLSVDLLACPALREGSSLSPVATPGYEGSSK